MQATRQRILEILKERGTATVEELGAELDLTPVTIRHHLDILRGEGLVQAPKVKRRDAPGRPQHIYALTDAADDYFPKNYAGFADLMLHEIRERVEPRELDSILRSMANRMAVQAPNAQPGESTRSVWIASYASSPAKATTPTASRWKAVICCAPTTAPITTSPGTTLNRASWTWR